MYTPDVKLKLAWVSLDLFERRELVEDGKSILNKFQFLPRTLSCKSWKTEETFVRCQQLNPELRPPPHSQLAQWRLINFAATLFERAICHSSNIFTLHFVLFLVFWGVVSCNQAASSSEFFGLRQCDLSMLAMTCE